MELECNQEVLKEIATKLTDDVGIPPITRTGRRGLARVNQRRAYTNYCTEES